MAARAGVEPTTLWLKVIISTKAPPSPTRSRNVLDPPTGALLSCFCLSHSSTMQQPAICVLALTIWNGFPLEVRLLRRTNSSAFFLICKSRSFQLCTQSTSWHGCPKVLQGAFPPYLPNFGHILLNLLIILVFSSEWL